MIPFFAFLAAVVGCFSAAVSTGPRHRRLTVMLVALGCVVFLVTRLAYDTAYMNYARSMVNTFFEPLDKVLTQTNAALQKGDYKAASELVSALGDNDSLLRHMAEDPVWGFSNHVSQVLSDWHNRPVAEESRQTVK